MGKVNELIAQRLKKSDQASKMSEMARQSVNGNLSGFSGIFSVSELSEHEKQLLESILTEYATDKKHLPNDLAMLVSITSEVKAINNQAAILHGERIKKAQAILTRYRDGAFSSWLMAAYGNRQTPYNFLQYYEFYENMPRTLRPKIEAMPRQAVYTLASRQGALNLKQKIVENYEGQTKAELLEAIRETFPLSSEDKRASDPVEAILQNLQRIYSTLQRKNKSLTKNQKQAIGSLLEDINDLVQNS